MSTLRRSGLALAIVTGLTSTSVRVNQTAPHVTVRGSNFVAVSVPDLEASTRWYRDVFGLSVASDFASPDSTTRGRVLRSDQMVVELISAKGAAQHASGATVPAHGFFKSGFSVDNLDSAIAVFRARGVTITGQWLQSRPRNLMIRDNSGNLIQFFEGKP